jgi:transposase-like protein
LTPLASQQSGCSACRFVRFEQKPALAEEAVHPGMTVSAVARLRGVSPSLLFK